MTDVALSGARPIRVPEGLLVPLGPLTPATSRLVRQLLAGGLDPAAVIEPATAVAAGVPVPAAYAEANRRLDTRLRAGLSGFFLAPNLHAASRRRQVEQARHMHLPAVALINRDLVEQPSHDQLRAEGFDRVVEFDETTYVSLLRRNGDWTRVPGPFVVVGDVHQCLDTLTALLERLGFDEELNHPDGLFPILAGDVVNKGGEVHSSRAPIAEHAAARTLRWVLAQHRAGRLGWVMGNNEAALLSSFAHPRMAPAGSSGPTMRALAAQPDAGRLVSEFRAVASRLPVVVDLLDAGREVHVVHAGYREGLRSLPVVLARRIALFSTQSWVKDWTASATVVYGHVRQDRPTVRRNAAGGATVGVETSAYRGGGLSAVRTDTLECVTEPTRPGDLTLANASRAALVPA